MPVLLDTSPQLTSPAWRPRTSLVVEWFWGMLVSASADDAAYPRRRVRFADSPGLAARLKTFWADGCDEYIELIVLAKRAGCLWECHPDPALSGLRGVVASGLGTETFDSETDEVARIVRGRLQRLANEPRIADGWLALVADTAAALGPAWESDGCLAAETAVRSLSPAAARSTGWPELAKWSPGCILPDRLPQLCEQTVAAGGEVVVAPSQLARKSFILAFGDLLLLGPHAGLATLPTEATRSIARQLRALADPTRLAMVEQLAIRPRGVGQLATDLQVSQPTISNHVRLLRDIGLVIEPPGGPRRQLTVDATVLDQILDDARTLVLGAPNH